MKIKIILIIAFLIITASVKAQYVTALFEGTDTVGAVLDSLTRQYTDSSNSFESWDSEGGLFGRWYRMTIAVNDTTYISTDATFPDNATFMLLPSESWTTEKWNVVSFPAVYIKSYSADIVTYRFSLEGD